MTKRQTAAEIRSAVREAYGARARAIVQGNTDRCCDDTCCSDSPATGVRERFYATEGTAGLPDSVVSYGCGNPLGLASLQTGETVLDLGSGAGLDCFLAGQRVGPTGHVIGLDMTDEMLALAEQNKAKVGATNVEFRKGLMEAIPLPDTSVDVIISNCVINLSPDKDAVFAEAFRVLQLGGRLRVSDVVLLHTLSAAEQADLNLWAGCIAGALERSDYAGRLTRAGFVDVSIAVQEATGAERSGRAWQSALITAYKPGGQRKSPRAWQGERIELVAPAGLETGGCCGEDCCSPSTAEGSSSPSSL